MFSNLAGHDSLRQLQVGNIKYLGISAVRVVLTSLQSEALNAQSYQQTADKSPTPTDEDAYQNENPPRD